MRHLPKARAVAIALATLVLAASCATAAPSARPAPAVFIIPTALPNGRVELSVAQSYRIGVPLSVPIAVIATSGTIQGPIAGRVLASGIGENGKSGEVLVRELDVKALAVTSGQAASTVSWDTRDAKGVLVPPDAYSLVLEFRSGDGTNATITRATASLELR